MKPAVVCAIAIGVGALAFFGGMQYQKSQRGSNFTGQMAGGNRGFNPRMNEGVQGNGGNQMPGGTKENGFQAKKPVSGEIVSIDKNTITVKTQDGSSKIITYSDQIKVNKISEGTISDLKTGVQITVAGEESTSGIVNAQSISIGSVPTQGK